MPIVDQEHDRPVIGVGRQQAEGRGSDRETIAGTGRAERQRAGERPGLGLRQVVDGDKGGAQQLGQPRERHPRLGLDPARLQQPHARRRAGGVLEQRGLADAGLADHRQHAAAPVSGLGQQPIDRELLLFAPKQHHPIVTRATP